MDQFFYEALTNRNKGYISPETQTRLRTSQITIAGCGMGSFVAEALVRIGCTHLTLIDGDTVEAHNLNRQNFTAEDIGAPKVAALAKRLIAINPEISIRTEQVYLDVSNASRLIEGSTIIIDTIDFLDLSGLIALHSNARALHMPIISALNVGFGAGCVYFPTNSSYTFEQIFDVQPEEEHPSYVKKFQPLLHKLSRILDPEVLSAMNTALTIMEDGKPCPASQVSSGALSAGAFVTTLVVRILSNQPVTPAPMLLLSNLSDTAVSEGVDLLAE